MVDTTIINDEYALLLGKRIHLSELEWNTKMSITQYYYQDEAYHILGNEFEKII